MNINELTIGQAKELANLFNNKTESNKPHPFEIGKNYFIRTVTMAQVGKLIEVYDDFLILSNASWVVDSGRFNDALRLGLLMNENVDIEPFVDNVIVNKNSIVDMTIYNHDLPRFPN